MGVGIRIRSGRWSGSGGRGKGGWEFELEFGRKGEVGGLVGRGSRSRVRVGGGGWE